MRLIETLLLALPGTEALCFDLRHAQVEEMTDGGMGSLRFVQSDIALMGKELVAALSVDDDGVPIHISLNLDKQDRLFELDLWKVDFSPLRRFPEAGQVTINR